MLLPHDRSSFFQTQEYWHAVHAFFQNELHNDGSSDITSEILFAKTENNTIRANIFAKQTGTMVGKEEASYFLKTFFPNIVFAWQTSERSFIASGQKIFTAEGPCADIMKAERILLNLLSRMSGVATQTQKYVTEVQTPLAATRKTQWSYLDKKAVWKAGGLSHRMGLFDAVLVKENHAISFGNGKKNIKKLLEHLASLPTEKFSHFLEIEVETPDEFFHVYEMFSEHFEKDLPKVIMFDNFSPEDIQFCMEKIPSKKQRHEKNIFLEISGGITLVNIKEYDVLDADVISVGALTHSVLPIDFSLRIEEIKYLAENI